MAGAFYHLDRSDGPGQSLVISPPLNSSLQTVIEDFFKSQFSILANNQELFSVSWVPNGKRNSGMTSHDERKLYSYVDRLSSQTGHLAREAGFNKEILLNVIANVLIRVSSLQQSGPKNSEPVTFALEVNGVKHHLSLPQDYDILLRLKRAFRVLLIKEREQQSKNDSTLEKVCRISDANIDVALAILSSPQFQYFGDTEKSSCDKARMECMRQLIDTGLVSLVPYVFAGILDRRTADRFAKSLGDNNSKKNYVLILFNWLGDEISAQNYASEQATPILAKDHYLVYEEFFKLAIQKLSSRRKKDNQIRQRILDYLLKSPNLSGIILADQFLAACGFETVDRRLGLMLDDLRFIISPAEWGRSIAIWGLFELLPRLRQLGCSEQEIQELILDQAVRNPSFTRKLDELESLFREYNIHHLLRDAIVVNTKIRTSSIDTLRKSVETALENLGALGVYDDEVNDDARTGSGQHEVSKEILVVKILGYEGYHNPFVGSESRQAVIFEQLARLKHAVNTDRIPLSVVRLALSHNPHVVEAAVSSIEQLVRGDDNLQVRVSQIFCSEKKGNADLISASHELYEVFKTALADIRKTLDEVGINSVNAFVRDMRGLGLKTDEIIKIIFQSYCAKVMELSTNESYSVK
ncbi:MAG: hypothetical protein QW808_00205 [Desulfurococcaceae archaeon]